MRAMSFSDLNDLAPPLGDAHSLGIEDSAEVDTDTLSESSGSSDSEEDLMHTMYDTSSDEE
eukprot:1624986-Pleurochrysis_carterae.AAC.1